MRPVQGSLTPQGRVAGADRAGWFDDVVGPGFVLLCGEDPAALLSEEERQYLDTLGARLVRVLPEGTDSGPRTRGRSSIPTVCTCRSSPRPARRPFWYGPTTTPSGEPRTGPVCRGSWRSCGRGWGARDDQRGTEASPRSRRRPSPRRSAPGGEASSGADRRTGLGGVPQMREERLRGGCSHSANVDSRPSTSRVSASTKGPAQLLGERAEDVVLYARDDLVRPGEQVQTRLSRPDHAGPAVRRGRDPLGEAVLLQLVGQDDHRRLVQAERLGDLASASARRRRPCAVRSAHAG